MNMFFWVGGLSVLWLTAMVVWSTLVPARRSWPVGKITFVNITLVWVPFLLLFGSVFVLGMFDWNRFGWHASIRWGIGGTLVLVGHIIVYAGVFKIGAKTTSGARGQLKTDGLYAYSRNPQYVADIAIFAGWIILSASLFVLPLALAGIGLLLLAPLSEEPWLREVYGKPYEDYRQRVRRFL